MLRSGIIAKKMGMTRLFMEDGKQIPVTVLSLENLQVVSQRTVEKDGYVAVQLGAGAAKAKRTSKAMRGHFAAAKVEPKRKVVEFRVSEENLIPVGEELVANHYFEGQYVDVSGVSIGKGFAGAMKRHNFGGLRATHGENLQVVRTDLDLGVIMVKGAVPGSKGNWVTVKDAVKKPASDDIVYPAGLRSAVKAADQTEAPVEGGENNEG